MISEEPKDNEAIENQNIEENKETLKTDFKTLLGTTTKFLKNLLDIRGGTDKKETIQKIKDGIPVKSHTAWILIFSILIASIGLNVSSTAVVIGAMLVSPLMGPILGIGLSIGINDIDTLKRSFVNLGVMVGLSLITSFIFFSFPIFQEATPEILARTKPDVRDVLIALAGGLALIVALSRKKEMTNTIAGIAIATALMPPLCTAGFGLATWNFEFFFGALFLFVINAIFIALATFVIVKFLRFPMVKYINQVKRKRIARLAGFIATIILSFSVYQFYLLFKENQFSTNAHKFIVALEEKTGAGIINNVVDYKQKNIKLIVLGSNIEQSEQTIWQNKLEEFGLKNTTLTIQQDNKTSLLQNEIEVIKGSYIKNQNLIATKDEIIQKKDAIILEKEEQLKRFVDKQIPFVQISQEAKTIYKGLEGISYSDKIITNFTRVDTLTVFEAQWNDSIATDETKQQLKDWLYIRLNKKDIILKHHTY